MPSPSAPASRSPRCPACNGVSGRCRPRRASAWSRRSTSSATARTRRVVRSPGHRLDAMGIVFPDLAGPYYSAVLLGAEEASVSAGSSLLILATHGRPQASELARELSARVDGLVVMGRTVDDDTVRALATRVPLVLLARESVDDIPTVRSASREPARTAHGAPGRSPRPQRLAFVGDPDRHRTPKTAGRGSRTPTTRWECRRRPPPSRPPFTSAGAGRRRARPWTDVRPTALVCASDEVAIGAYGALRRTGPAPRARRRRDRVGRHPARAFRLTRPDHRSAADGPARPHRRGAAGAARGR